MGRRKKGLNINGWVILDKPHEMTSTQAVGKVKWLFNANKAGHAGTLDPLATGLLAIALGEATKTVPFIMDGSKTYDFTLLFGEETDSCDAEGTVVETSDRRPSREEIETILPEFTGLVTQVPPAFSAIKVNGERAYDLAREGEAVELEAREVEIDALDLVSFDGEEARFSCLCGKGTYIRSLARDIAKALGTCGRVSALRRLAVGPFSENDMISLDIL
ncbi:MAG: tRNA pseudouridine(55) synthase TruB, partial [Pseudomonadota bacterium]